MNHSFVNRIRGLVRENTSRQTRDEFFNLIFVAAINNIIIHECIITVEIGFLAHILKKATYVSGQMKNMSWLVLFKHGFSFSV